MEEAGQQEGLAVRTYFVRNRNALVARSEFEDLYVDYYLGLADRSIRHIPEHDQLLKDAIAGITLHCASRPRNESIAWTVNFQDPLVNLFVAGDNGTGTVIGNLFTEDVRMGEENLFYVDTVKGRDPARRSVVTFSGSDVLAAAEHFYRQSEQRPARFLRLGEEDFLLVAAQPDCDMQWFEGLNEESAQRLREEETLSLLEIRHYKWQCGCSEERILGVIANSARNRLDELFGKDGQITASCPRCGARYSFDREQVASFLDKK